MTLRNLGTNVAALNNAFARLSGVQAVASANGALVTGAHNPVDASGGSKTMTLADAPSAGLLVAVSKKDASANTVAVSVAHLRDGGAGTITLVGQHESLLLTSKADGSWWPVGDHKTKAYFDGAYVGKPATATSGALGISPNPANQVGPNADNFFVVGGETSFPNAIGDARLAHVMGYDDKVWDKSIAAMVLGFHCIVGGTSGHETVGGGSMHAVFGGYSTVPGGLGNRTLAAKAVVSGDSNSAGANAIAALTSATAIGDTTITVDDPTGVAVGQIVYVGLGTPGLNNGDGPLERATVASIAGSVITLSTFQAVTTTGADGLSTGTALAAVHPIGARVFFSDGTKTGCTVCGGFLNDAMGINATVVGGRGNQAPGDYSTASGYYTKAAGTYSRTTGRYSYARTLAQWAHSAGRFAVTGDTQLSGLHCFGTTTDGTTAVTLNPAGSGGTMHQLLRGQLVGITARIVGQSSDGTVTAYYVLHHVAQFGATGNSAWLGSPVIQAVREDAGIGGVSFTAGSSAGSINIKVTGKAATTMRWTAAVDLTEVQN